MRRFACAALLALGCHDFKADLDVCLATGKCACPYVTFPAPFAACGSDRDLYLAADGDDANAGTDAAAPRRTLAGVAMLPGDRVHLAAGTYVEGLNIGGPGTSSCPITVSGAGDHATVFQTNAMHTVRLLKSYVRLSNIAIVMSGTSNSGTGLQLYPSTPADPLTEVVVDDVHIDAPGGGTTHVYVQQCQHCVLMRSSFTGGAGTIVSTVLQTWASDETVLFGNDVEATAYGAAFFMRDPHSHIFGNTFRNTRAAIYVPPGDGHIFERNVVHDTKGGIAVDGAGHVLHNTFVNLGTGAAASTGEFRGNIVSIAGIGLDGGAPEGGGYNLFNAVTPYLGGGAGATDVQGLPKLDADDTPQADSPALDAADPNDPVPAGGGVRADIGAIERGAVRLPDGRYCVASDAGY